MRILAMLAASAHLSLAACAAGQSLDGSGTASPVAAPADQPYMRCMSDFWGNCTAVVSSRHEYRWRYVRPGVRPPEAEPAARNRARETEAAERSRPRDNGPAAPARAPEVVHAVALRAPPPPAPRTREVEAAPAKTREAEARPAPARPDPAPRVRQATDSHLICHPRRRVVGDERPSRDDAQRAAENAWMGSIRYDFGERYQDINRAKDVRHVCGPSSISTSLKTPHFRCVVEATPCRSSSPDPVEPAPAPAPKRQDREVEVSSTR